VITDSARPDEFRPDETRSPSPGNDQSPTGPATEGELDEQIEDSFPASDPPANH
jgi:hypothetical protein